MVNAVISDRYGRRGLCAILMSVLALVGYISASLARSILALSASTR